MGNSILTDSLMRSHLYFSLTQPHTARNPATVVTDSCVVGGDYISALVQAQFLEEVKSLLVSVHVFVPPFSHHLLLDGFQKIKTYPGKESCLSRSKRAGMNV